MNAKPFLTKFARPIPSDSIETGTSEAPDRGVKEKSQNRRLSTIMTKVARETTDDR